MDSKNNYFTCYNKDCYFLKYNVLKSKKKKSAAVRGSAFH